MKALTYINRSLNNLKLNARFNLFIVALLLVVFASLGYYLYDTQKKEIFNKADKQLLVLLEDLINIFEVQTDMKNEKINSSISFTQTLYNLSGGITIGEDTEIEIIDKNKKSSDKTNGKKWYLNNKELNTSNEFVDFIKSKGVETVSFFQKTSRGFVRISTNLLFKDGTRAKGTLLPEDSPIISIIDSKKPFLGRIYEINDWYISAFNPIIVNNEVVGILSVGVKQMDYDILKPLFYEKKYFESGYPYVVSGDGFSVINVTGIEGRNLKELNFYKKLVHAKNENEEKFRYKWPETDEGQWKWTYFKYFKPLDIYVATSVFEYELYSGLDKIRNGIIWGVIISIIIFYIGVSFIIRPITSAIQKLVEIIDSLSKGRMVEKIIYRRNDEIGDIAKSLNILIDGWGETSRFSNEIEKGNFDYEFTPLSKEDMLGNSLLDMRSSLKRAKEQEMLIKQEEEKRQWVNEGLARFSDILQSNSDNVQQLGDNLLKNLIKYMNANQGGLFVADDQNGNEFSLDLVSSFAYNRKKFFQKKVYLGDGLLGAAALEKETIYMTNLPESYIEIESGLGTSNPGSVLIVPIKLDNNVLGVLEIASFNNFFEHEIKFVEKLAENVASSLSITKINTTTQQLLIETQFQAKELSAQEEEMRQNLEELQASQEESARRQAEMSAVLNALDTTFLVGEFDMEGRIIRMNTPFLLLFKLNPMIIEGKTVFEALQIREDQVSVYKKLWEELTSGKNIVKIQSKHTLDGKDIWLSEIYTLIYDLNSIPYKVLNIAVEITDSKHKEIEIENLLLDSKKKEKKLAAQERLNHFNVEKLEKMQKESEKKESEMYAILNAIDSTIIRAEYTKEGNLIIANTRYSSILEYTQEELLALNIHKLIPEDEKEFFEHIWKTVITGNSFQGIVNRISKSGKIVTLIMSYTPVIDKDKNISKVLLLANEMND